MDIFELYLFRFYHYLGRPFRPLLYLKRFHAVFKEFILGLKRPDYHSPGRSDSRRPGKDGVKKLRPEEAVKNERSFLECGAAMHRSHLSRALIKIK